MTEKRETTTRAAGAGTIEADTPDTSMALARVPVEERGIRGLQLASQLFSPEEREQVAALLAVPANSPALMPYLALCIAEGFSPWANHVWLIPKKVKIRAADGEEEKFEEKHLPAVGRDGLLHKARQSPLFDGLDFGVVCEHDSFEAWYEDREWHVLHRQAHKPTEFAEGESPDRWRGRVIGAWSLLFLKGRRPTYYYANLREHGRRRQVWAYNEGAHRRSPLYHNPAGGVTFAEFAPLPGGGMQRNRPVEEWEGAWDYLSTMILKASQSYVCRIGLGVTGFVPVDELRSVDEWQSDTGAAQAAAPADSGLTMDFDFEALPVDEGLRERLRRAVDTANEQEPFSWGAAKCEMAFTGRPADELATIVEQIEVENDLREQRIARAAGEETITDAEVVHEDVPRPAEGVPSDLDSLRVEAADLARNLAAAQSEEEEMRLRARLDQVEAEIRAKGGEDPGQGTLGGV